MQHHTIEMRNMGHVQSSPVVPRSGYQHLYLHASDGTRVRALTGGEWTVEAVKGVDEVVQVQP